MQQRHSLAKMSWCSDFLSKPRSPSTPSTPSTPRSPKDMLKPMTPGVMFNRYNDATPDGLTLVRPERSLPLFTPYYVEKYLLIGPKTPSTPSTPTTPSWTPEMARLISEANLLYDEHYYWYWLLDSLFNYDNEEQDLIEEIRINAMAIAYQDIEKNNETYESLAFDQGVDTPNERFLNNVFGELIKRMEASNSKLSIIQQIMKSPQYRAASGKVSVEDIQSECSALLNTDDLTSSADSARDVDSDGLVGGSTRRRYRRMNTIKKYKKRTRRRTSKRKYRKSRTTRRR